MEAILVALIGAMAIVAAAALPLLKDKIDLRRPHAPPPALPARSTGVLWSIGHMIAQGALIVALFRHSILPALVVLVISTVAAFMFAHAFRRRHYMSGMRLGFSVGFLNPLLFIQIFLTQRIERGVYPDAIPPDSYLIFVFIESYLMLAMLLELNTQTKKERQAVTNDEGSGRGAPEQSLKV